MRPGSCVKYGSARNFDENHGFVLGTQTQSLFVESHDARLARLHHTDVGTDTESQFLQPEHKRMPPGNIQDTS